MNLSIQWSGKWTPITLVELTNHALRKAFPRCKGIELKMGFGIARMLLDSEPSDNGSIYEKTSLIGKTKRHGVVEMQLITSIKWPIQKPVSLTISCRGREECFVIRTRKPVSKPHSKK
jgi:hypothetical protein